MYMSSKIRAIWKRLDIPWWGWCLPCELSPTSNPFTRRLGLMFAVIATGDFLSNAFAVKEVSGRSMQVRRAIPSLAVRINEF